MNATPSAGDAPSPHPDEPLAPASLIVGCGYLGRRLAPRLLGRGSTVFGTTRGPRTSQRLAALGVRPMMVRVTQPLTLAALRPALEASSLDVYHMVPPGRPADSPSPRQVILGGIAHIIRVLRQARVRRAVLVSSTAVYGQSGGVRVDADTPPRPVSERGKLLRAGEQLWLDAGENFHVLRLAGLYGPDRIIGLKAVQQGAPFLGDPQALLNLIHAEDAAALLEAMARASCPGQVELGCDGSPTPRLEYYSHLARKLAMPPPPVMDADEAAKRLGVNADRLRRASSKACDHIATCARTGWSPRYPSFREGLEALLPGAPW